MSAQPHEWEQIDIGRRYCLHCPATGEPDDPPFCVERVVAKPDNHVILRREIDRLSRQMGRMSLELKNLSEMV